MEQPDLLHLSFVKFENVRIKYDYLHHFLVCFFSLLLFCPSILVSRAIFFFFKSLGFF